MNELWIMPANEKVHLHEDDTDAVVMIASAFSISYTAWVVLGSTGGNGSDGPVTPTVSGGSIVAWIVENENIGQVMTAAGNEAPTPGLVFVAPRVADMPPVRVGTVLQSVIDDKVRYRVQTLFVATGFLMGKVEPA